MNPIERFREDVTASTRRLARIDEIAAATGISPKTLRNLHYGATRFMRYENVAKLETYYEGKGTQ